MPGWQIWGQTHPLTGPGRRIVNYKDIDDEVLAGLTHERDRLDEARKCADFYAGRFDAYQNRPLSSAWEANRYARTSLVMNRIVKSLTGDLYGQGPTRQLPDHPGAQQWLADVYKNSGVDSLLQAADRWATVSDVALLQAHGTEDPDRPVRVQVWPADQFCVWESPDDALTPVAVATIDKYDNRRRLRRWTQESMATYATDKAVGTIGGTDYKFIREDKNPYGVLPFASVHFEQPSTEFWSGGPGQNLADLNDYTNYYLTEGGDSLRYCAKPIIKALGVRAGWRPSTPIQPGDIWDIPSEGVDASGNGIPPDVGYMQADMSFIEAGWLDLQSFLDHSLECYGVPPAAIRMVQSAARSGVSIVAEQLPLLKWAISRQRPFSTYELALATVVLRVGAAHLGQNGLGGGELAAAADSRAFTLRWGNLLAGVVDSQQDQHDTLLLQQGRTSRVRLMMRDENLSETEAKDALLKIAEQRAWEGKLLGPIAAPAPPAPAPPADDQNQAESQSQGENENENENPNEEV